MIIYIYIGRLYIYTRGGGPVAVGIECGLRRGAFGGVGKIRTGVTKRCSRCRTENNNTRFVI